MTKSNEDKINARCVPNVWENRNVVGTPEKTPRRRQGHIKMDLKDITGEGVDCNRWLREGTTGGLLYTR